MSAGHLHVDRLELRLHGASPADARAAVDGLGRALLDELARRGAVRADTSVRIERLAATADAGTDGAGSARGALARAAAAALAPHLPSTRGR